MTPRPDIVAIQSHATVRDARALFREQEYSRFPVYTENLDNISGIIYVKDFLLLADAKDDEPVTTYVRPAIFVPETKRVPELLREFQHRQAQMAIVVDEYGGTAGLVTIEDLLEETRRRDPRRVRRRGRADRRGAGRRLRRSARRSTSPT